MAELIRAEKLTRRYVMGETIITAVDSMDLVLQEGEFTAVIGRSGSGKSTLLHLLGGLDRPTSGEIVFRGQRLSERSDDELALHRRVNIGFIFQFFNLIPTRTALQNVELPLILGGEERLRRVDRARELLERVGLKARVDHRARELSGGAQQRVAIARALIHDPPLLLADEPTGNLDTRTSGEIMDLLAQTKKTILLVTHDRALAAKYARRSIEMSDGKIATDSRAAA